MGEEKRILHLGLGSFHRAHQAVYLHHLHLQGERDWVLAGGNIRPDNSDFITSLKKAGGRYHLETVDPSGKSAYEEITSITHVLEYHPQGVELIAYGSDSKTKIISFTVTEAGYYLDAEDRLVSSHPEILADWKRCQQGEIGNTIYGAIYAILDTRRKKYPEAKITLLSCDNLRHNGIRFRKGFEQFIERIGNQEFLHWLKENTSTPNDMVDRITPRPTPEVVERVRNTTGKEDPNALMGEAFIQWVLEDHFIAGRPAWEKVGAELVRDVSPYEEAKIRILNATHSCIAWAGTLVGYNYIHEGTADERIRKFAFDYITEDVIPLLQPSPVALEKYRDVVLDRFLNAAIRDTNQRVAMDGFSKIPGFIVPTIRERLARQEGIAAVIVLPALFFLFLLKWDRGGLPYRYDDQAMNPQVAQEIFQKSDPSHSLKAFCGQESLWDELAGLPIILEEMSRACSQIEQVLGLEKPS